MGEAIIHNGKIYKSVDELWFSEEGDKVKERIKKKRGYKCEITGLNYGNIEFHHILPKKLYPELIFDEKNIIMVLVPIHKLIHNKFSLEKQNKETLELFKSNYYSGAYGEIDLTAKRDYIVKDKFTVINNGSARGKHRYSIKDKNDEVIFSSQYLEKAEKECEIINKTYNYKIHTKKDIRKFKKGYQKNYFTIAKDGHNNNKQRYAIRDMNGNTIVRWASKEKIKILCKTLNIFFDYYTDTAEEIKIWIKKVFNPYYGTFDLMVSMFCP